MAKPVPLEQKTRKHLTLKRKLSLPVDSLGDRYKQSPENKGKLPEIHEAIQEVQDEEICVRYVLSQGFLSLCKAL